MTSKTEDKVREVIRVDLQISRDIPILRAQRIKSGPQVRGTHPILGQYYNVEKIQPPQLQILPSLG